LFSRPAKDRRAFSFGAIIMSLTLTVLNDKPVLGSFDKAIEGAASLNFGASGGKNCDMSCKYHPKNVDGAKDTRCYAYNTEQRFDRVELKKKLARHEDANPTEVVERAIGEVTRRRRKISWFRFSTNGSVPKPQDCTPEFVSSLRDLTQLLQDKDVPVHFPVESPSKARFYRRVLSFRVVVRESCQNLRRFLHAAGAVSFVAGNRTMNIRERMVEAKRLARLRTEKTGRKCVVCPAVATRYYASLKQIEQTGRFRNVSGSPKAKCGNCVACAQPGVDVIYPAH
jgi:hypothetical protein